MEEKLNNISIEIEDFNCSICLEKLNEDCKIITNCNHLFCENCIEEWFNNQKYSCPICRSDIKYYYNKKNKTKILPINIETNNEQTINNIPIIFIIRGLARKNLKYRAYIILLFGFSFYKYIQYYLLNLDFIEINKLYKECENNFTKLEDFINNDSFYINFMNLI